MCIKCQQRRETINKWKEKALESYRKLIGRSTGVNEEPSESKQSADRAEQSIDSASESTDSTYTTAVDGDDAGSGTGSTDSKD